MNNRPITITLDTNCIIALDDESRLDSAEIRRIVDAHRDGLAIVHVIAIMASEKQKEGGHLDDFKDFAARLHRMGLGDLPQVFPLLYFDVSYWGHCLLATPEATEMDQAIHQILFPEVPDAYPETGQDKDKARWRNAKCDVQAIWSHINAGNQIFVSSDRNFHKASKRARLEAMGAGRILQPAAAAALF